MGCMFPIRVLWVLSIAVASACAGFGQSRDVFPEPQSTLLFSGEDGDLNLVTPSGNSTVPHLPKWVGQWASPLPAISPSGDRVARSLKFMLNADSVKCDPSKKGWCDPQPRPIFKSVMGVYSVRDKTWKQYGDFYQVGSAAFSPDGTKIAFKDGSKLRSPEADDLESRDWSDDAYPGSGIPISVLDQST